MNKPRLYDFKKPIHINDYPIAPCYKAGHLVSTNKSYRIYKPILNNKCINCLVCYISCPEGTIQKGEKSLSIDYDFCKGCGICVNECKFQGIEMVKEDEDYGK